MITNFASKWAQDIFDGVLSRNAKKVPINIHDKIRRLFDQLNSAQAIRDLEFPPGNNLQRLKGDLAGKWSIRVNKQWRIIFEWKNDDALNVDVVDYH